MTVYPNLGLTIPTRGTAGVGHWADVLDADIALIDAHDHTVGKGLPILTGAITIDADLSFRSLWAVSAMHRVSFSSVTPLTTNNKSLFVSSADNELYFRSNTGSNIKLTDGTSINVAGFLGSIGGDYVSVGALADYDSSTHSYRMRQELGSSVRQYARTKTGSIDLLEFKAAGTTPSVTVFVRLSSPAALANTYEVTFPDALPASTSLAQYTSAGVMTFSNTVAKAATFTELVTLTAGATAAANQSITVSGTGDFKHGTRTLPLSAVGMQQISGTAFTRNGDGSIQFNGVSVGGLSLPVVAGQRVNSVVIAGFGDGAVDPVIEVFKFNSAGTTAVYATATITNSPAGWNDTTATPGSPAALLATECLFLRITSTAGTFAMNTVRVVYDRP